MIVLSKGDSIWIKPRVKNEFTVDIGACVIDVQNGRYLVRDDDGNVFDIDGSTEYLPMHPGSVKNISDMIALGELNECGILRNLYLRYKENLIYTYTGAILIAINPYRSLPIYSVETMKEYSNKDIGELPPHLFAIGDNAYRNMHQNNCDQCIIISGESGAGKTESTKLLLQFITTVSGKQSCIGKQILDSNPIMEAFGNAKTVRNDNSSRFGKYVDIHFDQVSGHIVSARIEQYLLEKSRIVTQATGERNYHAFYCMLAGMSPEDKRRLGLQEAKSYSYLYQDTSNIFENHTDAIQFQNIISTMQHLNFDDMQINQIWHILAAILHLGNITFCEAHRECTDASKVDDCGRAELRFASSLLGIGPFFLERALTTRCLHTAGECVVAQFLPANAHAVRDAFAKTIYDQLFQWIVEKINAAIYHPVKELSTCPALESMGHQINHRPVSVAKIIEEHRHAAQEGLRKSSSGIFSTQWMPSPRCRSKTVRSKEIIDGDFSSAVSPSIKVGSSAGLGRISIGVLDIFGFENFSKNSFEQLCINYANENIQQYFVRHIFKLEQEEYLAENINWTHISFKDNQDVLNLIAHHPLNVLALIDEESRFPKGTDESFLNKLNNRHDSTPNYMKSLSTVDKRFGIHHFAGPVFYDVNGFLEKNKDTFNHDLLDVIRSSKNFFLRELFASRLASNPKNRTRPLTLSMQFKHSLERLMQIINGCHPYFVRCIKPNELKIPSCFDRDLCIRQLRYSGMMETIQIRRLGYPIRYAFDDFINRFRMIVSRFALRSQRMFDMQNLTELICRTAFTEDTSYAIGKKKVFLRVSHSNTLERLRETIRNQKATIIQSVWKGMFMRQRYRRFRRIVIFCQQSYRQSIDRRYFLKVRNCVILLQAYIRGFLVRKRYQRTILLLLEVQKLSRRWLAKRNILRLMEEKQYVNADLVLENVQNTNLIVCEKTWPEDVHLTKTVNIGFWAYPAVHDQIQVIHLIKEVPEECKTKQSRTTVSESKWNNPTQIATVYSTSDLDNLVDEIFGGIFDSVDPEKRARSITYPGALTITENQVNLSSANVQEQKHQFGLITENTHINMLLSTVISQSIDSSRSETAFEGDHSVCISTSADELSTVSQAAMDGCSFLKFAAAFFQTGSNPHYTKSRIFRPLLKHRHQRESLLALDVFARIQSFMKTKCTQDKVLDQTNECSLRPGSSISSSGSIHGYMGDVDADNKFKNKVNLAGSLSNKSKTKEPTIDWETSMHEPNNGCPAFNVIEDAVDKPDDILRDLKEAQLIVGAGIDHPLIRDEIFCQLLKQITKNPCDQSRSRGWILLALCASCFPPMKFNDPLRAYLKSSPSIFSRYCMKRLNRVHQTGVRSKPPSYMELKAARERKCLMITIHCADNTQFKVKADSAVTVDELCEDAFKTVGFKDSFGFEVFINIFEKSYALSLGPKHLFDTISFCEQHASTRGIKECDLPWSFSIRKTIFSPWHDVGYDPVATAHICYQVCQQFFDKTNETLEEHELAFLLANMYRLFSADVLGQHGGKCRQSSSPSTSVDSWLSDTLGCDCDTQYLACIVGTALQELESRSAALDVQAIKESIVAFAKVHWSAVYSRQFEVIFLGDDRRKRDITLTVNCNGIQLHEIGRKDLLFIQFIEIHSVCANPTQNPNSKIISLKTVWMKEYRFVTTRADELKKLLIYMLTGLRQRSRYAIATKAFCYSGVKDKSLIQLGPGDFLVLNNFGWELNRKQQLVGLPKPPSSGQPVEFEPENGTLCSGVNKRTMQAGRFPISHIYILPTTNEPQPEFIDAFAQLICSTESEAWLNSVEGNNLNRFRQNNSTFPRSASAMDSFLRKDSRPFADRSSNNPHRSVSRASEAGLSFKSTTRAFELQHLLHHVRQPLKTPFLWEFSEMDQRINEAAMLSFAMIQNFMGDSEDLPAPLRNVPDIILTDLLFVPALECPLLRDEFYVQLMNQLTHNPTQSSEDKGWELMWLATGSMIPTSRLSSRLISFLHRSSHLMASCCYIRLHHTKSRGNRKKPPHPLELSAVRACKSKISQQILLPNGHLTTMRLESATKISEVIMAVVKDFNFTGTDTYAVYLTIEGEKRYLPNDEYVFDCLSLSLPAEKKIRTRKKNYTIQHEIIHFSRRFFDSIVPGKDVNEDLKVNFPQILDNFLEGYYHCPLEQVLKLSALIYIWLNGQATNANVCLRQCLPKNVQSFVTESEWMKKFALITNEIMNFNKNDIPFIFLGLLSNLPSFGSRFFDVHPSESEEDWHLEVNITGINFRSNQPEKRTSLEFFWSDILECWHENDLLILRLHNHDELSQWTCTNITAFNAEALIKSYIHQSQIQQAL